ncbi:MAG TPA: VanZ family protein [Noviherbaspirillum sp.]|uniref:VanZ family protein n=1 Tax=Noviherbaspirillum sp. TaxID=1926288 RepID=UPI002D3225D5|nr:VanZ family protein [Noviherbaspirillum sp.]HYD97465.1 VanZ family protein [Noviherbaspirillum sp.]
MLDEENLQTAPRPAAAAANVSTFARFGLLMYTFLIVYASLYPFSNWHSIGLAPWSFLLMPMPHYWTGFDVGVNMVGYFPFGMLVVFALYPTFRGLPAALIAILCGMLLSGALEAIQTYLPSRVSSNLDFLTNFAGAFVGACAGALLSRTFLEQSRLLQLRQAWFVPDAGRGLIIAGLWPLAQIYPQGYLFGHGELMPILSDWLSDWLETPVDLIAVLTTDLHLTVQEYWLAETLITAFGMTGALLTWSLLLRKQVPRPVLLIALLAVAMAAKSLASALAFAPANAFAWLTPGAKGGVLIGTMMVGGLSYAPPAAQRRIAAACLLLGVVAINLVPANPYFMATLQAWIQGKFLNFNGAAHFLAVFWPFFALWFLLHPAHRAKRT